MCSPPNVVDLYIHSLLDKLDQGFSRPLMKQRKGNVASNVLQRKERSV
jgi:hypothetical protein